MEESDSPACSLWLAQLVFSTALDSPAWERQCPHQSVGGSVSVFRSMPTSQCVLYQVFFFN